MKVMAFTLTAVLAICSVCYGAVRQVPGTYPTIQAGIDAALDGDTVVVAPGLYRDEGNRDLDFGGKAITVRSSDPNNIDVVAATIIDCQGNPNHKRRGFYFHNGETSASVVAGFTITNGYASLSGGGIYCYQSNPRIIKCIISGNENENSGGGIGGISSSMSIESCIVRDNSARHGGGIDWHWGQPTISNSLVVANRVEGRFEERGGGIHCYHSSPNVDNCTITDNIADCGGAIYCYGSSNPTLRNCIVWGNEAPNTPEIYAENVSVSYSNVEGGFAGAGNIDNDPCFVDGALGDYHLSANSVCINAGDPNFVCAGGETDIDGQPRVMGGRIDMGADEFADEPIIKVSPSQAYFSALTGGPNPAPQVLSISNSGGGVLNWTLTYDCEWLDVDSNSGSAGGDVDEVTLSVDVTGLSRGEYQCLLLVSDPCALNNPQPINVNLLVFEPIIELSAEEFTFTSKDGNSNPEDQILSIWNSGNGVLNWEISESCPWLEVNPTSGSSEGEFSDVVLSVDITGLASGSYDCTMTVTDPNAPNSPRIVTVNLIVMMPALELSTNNFDFVANEGGSNPASQVLDITNVGGGTLVWEISYDCNWLNIAPDSGSSQGETDSVTVDVNIMGLVGGMYNCEVTVSDPNAHNSPQTVDVNLRVYGPEIELSCEELAFFACELLPDPNSQFLTIGNSGGGTLEWSIDYDCNWLTVEPNSGSCSGVEVNEVVLSVDTSGMIVGDYYTCEMTVSDSNAENDPQTVWVSLNLIVGDFDTDCDVDMRDFGIMGLAWLSGPGDGHWNPDCDISSPKDDVIDELDLDVLGESWLLSAAGGGGGSGRTITIRPQGGGGPYSTGEIVTIELYATGYCGPMGNWLGSLDIAAITASGVWGSTNPSAVDVGSLAPCLMEPPYFEGIPGTGTDLITNIVGRGSCDICGFVLYEFDLDVGDEGGGFVIDLSGVTTLNPFAVPLSVDVVPLSVTVVDANSSDEVVISCTATEGLPGEVTVSYTCTEPNYVRGFALDITVDSGAVIDSVYDVNGQYWVYPGSIDINEAGEIVDYGSVVCDPCVYPGTLGGLGTNGITVEMGALFEPVSGSPPASSGTLLKFTADKQCNVSIGLNTVRGGVVMKDPASVPTVTLNGCIVAKCCPPDSDNDGDIDLADYYAIQGNLAYADYLLSGGLGISYYIDPGHVIVGHLWNECMDTDGDEDIDLNDYYSTQGVLAYASYLCGFFPTPAGIECDPLRVLPGAPGHLWPCP